MKFSATTFLLAGAGLFAATTQAYVVEIYRSNDCSGDILSTRNVWDNTCAYTKGFSSFKLVKHGGDFQHLTAWSRQACAGPGTAYGCAAGINSLPLGQCYRATNDDGGSNALSSYSSGGDCPK